MSTSASIALKMEDGEYYKTTVNWDGYLSYVGKILYDNYTEYSKVFDLINDGEIRSFNIVEDNEIEVEYYDDGDYYPLKTKDHETEYYNYFFEYSDNKFLWYVSFYDNDSSSNIVMELGEALEKYGSAH